MGDDKYTSGLLNLMMNRRSLRRYRSDPVPREQIEYVLNAALWAPSAHNRQPWRFAVLRQDTVKKKLAEAMGQRLQQDLENDHVPEAVIRRETERSFDRITSAPVVILVALSMADMDTYPDPARSRSEYLMAVQSTAMAGENLLLAAHEQGLGACWMCAPLFCPEVVQRTLELPEDWQAQGMITLGYPDQERNKTRFSLETRVLWY